MELGSSFLFLFWMTSRPRSPAFEGRSHRSHSAASSSYLGRWILGLGASRPFSFHLIQLVVCRP